VIDFDDALKAVLKSVRPLPAETIPLDEADGRVLFADIRVRLDLPRFDQSAMDGYAVCVADTKRATRKPVALRLTGEMPAGCSRRLPLRSGCAVKVFTGSMLPRGAGAVVMKEYTTEGDGIVVIERSAKAGQHIRRRGEELRRGDPLLAAGTVVTPPVLGLLAANGIGRVRVHRQPAVALVTLGDELAAPGTPLKAGKIRDANGPALAAAMRRMGVATLRHSTVGDDPKALRRVLAREMRRCEIVVTVGGASVGDHDHVEAVRAELGVREHFNRVAIKPGKPNVFGISPEGCFMYGLPGNPVSALVSFHQFVAPALRRLRGEMIDTAWYPSATLTMPIKKKTGRLEWVRGVVDLVDGRFTASATRGQGSHMLSGLAAANALLEIPRGVDALPAGVEVRVRLLRW
jgi:molybdopterin molybdotransferase